jgi:hypothetical protein
MQEIIAIPQKGAGQAMQRSKVAKSLSSFFNLGS